MTVYFLEERNGCLALYHFIVYNLGGLYYIKNKIYDIMENYDFAKIQELDDTNKESVKLYLKLKDGHLKQTILEAFTLLRGSYELVDEDELTRSDIINIYGEPCNINGASDNHTKIFPFLRRLFLDRIQFSDERGKKIFIGRKRSIVANNTCHGQYVRCIINEDEFSTNLQKHGIETIYLEDYSFEDKIRLFHSCALIISTGSSALTFCLWCNPDVKVVEMNRRFGYHYSLICNTLNLQYHRYTAINEDYHSGNFVIEDTDPIYEYIYHLIESR